MPLAGVVGVLSLGETMRSGAIGVGGAEDSIGGIVDAGEDGVILAGRSACAGFE